MKSGGGLWVQPAFEPAQVTTAAELVAEVSPDALVTTVPDGYVSVTLVDQGASALFTSESSSAAAGASTLKAVASGN